MALRRLYWGPSRVMSCPRMTKFAATNGVGAMMVVEILGEGLVESKHLGAEDDTHCIKNGLSSDGFLLDHKRALQPSTSVTHASTAVGIMNHSRV